ncbi:Asp-tRNA(Asn)/Glu-tRNA(Gln) amidotransferase GatCAB subunit A, partial [Akkermansiaceae bacterium]|nr:Asp-tRNA(Asn)/Glu-tRNA(Gln) amidotransferase GatCAB subunit A [Akkermansiaceae bacterium]
MSLAAQTLSSLRRQLTAGDISSRDIVEDAIAQVAARDGEIGAFISHDPETALAEAEKADLSLPLG